MNLSVELGKVMEQVREANKLIEENKPWELVKSDKEKFEIVMNELFTSLFVIYNELSSFMPETSEKIKAALETKKAEPLFQRIK